MQEGKKQVGPQHSGPSPPPHPTPPHWHASGHLLQRDNSSPLPLAFPHSLLCTSVLGFPSAIPSCPLTTKSCTRTQNLSIPRDFRNCSVIIFFMPYPKKLRAREQHDTYQITQGVSVIRCHNVAAKQIHRPRWLKIAIIAFHYVCGAAARALLILVRLGQARLQTQVQSGRVGSAP